MSRYLTILAATLATVSAQYGGGSQPQPQQYGQQQGSSYQPQQQQQQQSNYGQQGGSSYQPPQQMSSGYGQQMQGSSYGGQQMNNMMAWYGMQQSSNAQQVGVVIISTNNGGSSQWQQVSSSMNMYQGNSSPQTHQVTVGAPGLMYTPNTIMANAGDYVQFNFMAQNHTVTQSNFNTPCVKMGGGVDSGFMPNMNNGTNPPPAMKIQVMNTQPMWFYCRQKKPEDHCGAGMTFSINPTASKTQQMFMQMAIQQNGTQTSSSNMGGSSASAVAVASPESSVSMGMGNNVNGQCQCQCLCGTNAYAPGYGVGMMGGLPGMMPMSPAPSP